MDLKEDGNTAFLAGDFDAASQLYDEAQASARDDPPPASGVPRERGGGALEVRPPPGCARPRVRRARPSAISKGALPHGIGRGEARRAGRSRLARA
jgi:hypothetical protein